VSRTEFTARYGTWTFIFGALMWGGALTSINQNFDNLPYAVTALVVGYEIARVGLLILILAAFCALTKRIGKRIYATTERD
jgi:uncharacterized membrane protein YjjP (DUF1212 family)